MVGQVKHRVVPVLASILVAMFVFMPSKAHASWAWEVYVYGTGDFTAAIFNGIAMIMGGDLIVTLLKIALLLGLLYLIAGPIATTLSGKGGNQSRGAEPFVAMLGIGILALILTVGMIFPKANVAIIDRVDPMQTQIVGNVPAPHAFIAHVVSTIGDVIGKEFETVFHMPDTLKFRNGGVALGAKYTDSLMNIYPPNSSTKDLPSHAHLITQSLREYYVRCVFPNFASLDGTAGEKTKALDTIFTTPNLMSELKRDLYRDPNMIILAPNLSGEATCRDAIGQIDDLWNEVYPFWLKDIETKLSAGVGTSGIAGSPDMGLGTGILTEDVVRRYFPESPVDAKTMLKNIAAINLLRDSVQSYLRWSGAPADSAYRITQRTTQAGWLTAAKFFNSIVHTIRAILEGLVYGMSVFIPVLIAATLSFKPLVTFLKIALWLQLWVPFYVILNLYADYGVQQSLRGLFLTEAAAAPTFRTIDAIATQTSQMLGIVGFMATMVPALSFGVIYGGVYAFSHFTSGIGGSATGTAQSVGGQVMGQGNMSLGNRSFMNESFGGSNVMTSQMGFRQQLIEGGLEMRRLNNLSHLFGGIENYMVRGAHAGAPETAGKINAIEGGIEAAGSSSNYVAGKRAKGHGEMAALLEGARERAALTGESWQTALANNMVDAARFNAIGNLAKGDSIGIVGPNELLRAEKGEIAARAAGINMMYRAAQKLGYGGEDGLVNDKEFNRFVHDHKGKDIGVVLGDERAKTLGFKKGGEFGISMGGDGQIWMVEASRGQHDKTLDLRETKSGIDENIVNTRNQSGVLSGDGLNDFAKEVRAGGLDNVANRLEKSAKAGEKIGVEALRDPQTNGLVAFTLRQGGRAEIEDYVKTTEGWRNTKEAVTTEESGHKKQVWDNFISTVGGSHTLTYDNFRETISGLREMGYNVRIVEDASANGGHRVMIQDPTTNQVVAGDIKNVITAYQQTVDGATRKTMDPTTGETIVSKSEIGEFREQFHDRLNMQMGVNVDGTVTHGVRGGVGAVLGEKAGEIAAVGVGTVADGIRTVGGIVGGLSKGPKGAGKQPTTPPGSTPE